MSVAATKKGTAPWLLLTFTLPVKRASKRVEVWRKLQRHGAVALGNSGYLLPGSAANQERFEWLATSVRKYAGEASVVRVQSIDNLSTPQLVARFSEARGREYQELLRELQKLHAIPRHRRRLGQLHRLRTRFREIADIDFFGSPLRVRVEELFERVDQQPSPKQKPRRVPRRDYQNRVWVTRPRPGIDRSASAWLIRHFIDRRARFAFAPEGKVPRHTVPYDMFHGGFGHHGEDCTFETLQKAFGIRERRVRIVGEMIHDADLFDQKFGRKEGFGVDAVLSGWARQGVPDKKLLERGIELVEGLYRSVSRK
jgi:hypothetical protein